MPNNRRAHYCITRYVATYGYLSHSLELLMGRPPLVQRQGRVDLVRVGVRVGIRVGARGREGAKVKHTKRWAVGGAEGRLPPLPPSPPPAPPPSY